MSHIPNFRASTIALIVLPVIALAACADSTGLRARQPVSVSFTATPTPRAARSLSPSMSLAPVGASLATAAASATIDKVQLVLSHIELERASGSCVTTPTGSEGECEEIELDPAVVDITVGIAGTKTLVTTPVPEGTYGSFHAKVEAVRAGDDRSAAFLAANKDFEGISVKVTGKDAAGKAFTYTSTAKGEIETEFNPPLDVKAGKNVTVELDVSSWFAGVVDPANPTAAERATIDARIRASLKAFEDNDKDGVPDKK